MKKILMLIAALLISGTMLAQQDGKFKNRKKVGVVLSGGGAKGMAHIGVLKVLEKAGIPVDIVTGTSMGSIIGGLYAIGYNADALDSVARAQDWTYVISDKEDLRNQSLRDRLRQYTYVFTTGLTIGKRDMNAGGLIKGKNLAELFQHLCTGYTDSLDFSKDLPIPFACVATDIIDNSEVDFHSGRLPQAMRSSMSIPGAFSPVRIGEKVLVDGGLKNNYPADIAKRMGADIIIGVTVQGPPKSAEDLGGTMSIIGQIVDVNCKNKVEENLAITDLHMQVNTKGYGSASFSAAAIDTLIRRGEEEAMAHWDEIIALKKRIGIGDSFRPVRLRPVSPQVMTEKLHVTNYTFENMTPQTEMFLRQKFHLSKRDSIDADLARQITTCMRTDLFYQTAECRFVPEKNGVRVIIAGGNRKTVQLHAGMRYDLEEHASLQVSADLPFNTTIPMNADLTLRLGKRIMVHGGWTIHPRSFTRPTVTYTFRRNDMDVYMNGDHDFSILYHQHQAEVLPLNFDIKHFNLQIGLRWDYIKFREKLIADDSTIEPQPLDNKHYISYRARAEYNSEDNWIFPTRGARFKAEYAYLTDNFLKLNGHNGMFDVSADWRMSFTFGKRFTLQPMVYGRLTFGEEVPPVFGNIIGGDWFGHYIEQQVPFAGVGNMEAVKKQFIAVQLQAQQRIATNHYILFKLAAGQQADKLGEIFDESTLLGGQIAYYYNTIFGPIGASLGYSNRTKKPYFFLNLGYEF